MRRTTTCCARQLLSSAPFNPTKETLRVSPSCLRPFSSTKTTAAWNTTPGKLIPTDVAERQSKDVKDLTSIFSGTQKSRAQGPASWVSREISPYSAPRAGELDYSREGGGALSFPVANSLLPERRAVEEDPEPYHFHIYSHKHNTHITVTTPERNPLISVSCGNIGFRKSGRKHYDSAYQLAGYVFGQMAEKGITHKITNGPGMAVVLRGFGQGREAVTKALLGQEGGMLRHSVKRVADSTRLKIGGSRSQRPRRLG